MALTVYQLAHSPYCIPITRAFEALGVSFQVRNISNADRREILELTNGAYYQVPVIEHNGRVVYESSPLSTDVARYVDRAFAGGRLFPAEYEGLQRIVIAHIENEIESVTFRLVDPGYLRAIEDPVERGMILRHKERKFGVGCVAAWDRSRSELTAQTAALLEPYDLALAHRSFLFGDAPLYADFALYGVLGNLTWQDLNALPAGQRALQNWFDRMKTFRFP